MKTYTTYNVAFAIILNLTICLNAQAQSHTNIDSLSKEKNFEVPYQKLLDREFTRILTSQNTNFGTFATIGIKDDIASLSGHLPIRSSSNLAINFRGGVTEGIASLLNGEKVNPNISVGLQYNIGVYSTSNTLRADATQVLNFLNTVDSLDIVTQKKREEIDLLEKKLKSNQLQNNFEIKQQNRKLDELNRTKSAILNKGDLKKVDPKLARLVDSLDVVFSATDLKLDQLLNDSVSLSSQIANLSKAMVARQKQNAEASKVSKFNRELEKLNLIGYKLRWFAFYGKLNNRTFNLFNPDLDYSDQIIKTSFNGFEIGASYNIYRLDDLPRKPKSPDKSKRPDKVSVNDFFRKLSLGTYYSSAAVSYLREDNFGDLTKRNLSQKQTASITPTSRTIEDNRTIYLGDYSKSLSKVRLSYDLYWFFVNNQSAALHLNPSSRISFDERTKFDSVIGLLVAFRNQEKDKSIINAELFYDLKDITKKSENDEDELVDRSSLGIRLNFPIYFRQRM